MRHVFVPIKVTTEYSLMKSLITVPKLMEYLLQNKIEVCGICDTNLYGVMEFYLACQKNHIKPLIGLEVFLGEISLYLYARDYTGYLDLLKIHTLVEKKELSMVALEMVESHLNIILPYAYSSHFKELMDKFQHLYLGYTTELEKNNSYLFTENAVYTQNICCFQKKDGTYLNLLKAIEENESVKSLPKENYEKNSFEEARLMEEDSSDFVSSISIEFPKPTRHIPKFDENNKDSYAYLCALAKKGLQKRMNQKVSKEAQERLQKELEVIHKMGFADYFLIVYDYVFFAKKNHILVGIGRGSAVGSLVSYCLGITDVNPLDYNLLFERFLNPERVTMPDIDIDFEEERRSEVISYVKEKYGEEKVAGIMTFGTLKSKLVLKSVAKALDMNSSVIEKFLSLIDPKLTLKENLQNNSISYYVKNNPDILKLYQISMKLEGLKRHISTHAAGIVISSNTLDEIIPIHYNGTELLTGVGMNYLEDLGLLKMDFLSLKNLSIISSILRLIEEHTNTKINLNKIDLNDSKVLHLFEVADTAGVFQFESEGMKNFLKKLKPKAFSDLIAAIALFRPGPMENIDTFIKRKEGKEKISYLHQDLEPILKETYGIIVYQEQVMQILVVIGGFSFAEADIIRRAMSKKKKEIIDEYEEKFMIGAKQKHYDEKLARDIYALILKFANYGFNKSHSVSYALIGYQMAYLKCYYKVYFIANLLNRNTLSVEKTKEYMALGKQAGITFLRPDINFSEENYKIENNTLRLPLALIKNLGSEGTKTILEERKKG
ncbi:MAG: DNA polymerase III subunit alpha, partial [Bacilli bacterium]|nr:DNA polymerase III subunit alpha [Bacilli bacterium]